MRLGDSKRSRMRRVKSGRMDELCIIWCVPRIILKLPN